MSRFFIAKAWLGGLGVSIGVVGMVWEFRALVWIAVALLGAAFLLRFVEKPRDA